MGLDISIRTDIDTIIFADNYYAETNDLLNKNNLSRTFCNLMCRIGIVDGETELDQIGRITSVDISSIYQMNTNLNESDEELEFLLEEAESEEERQALVHQSQQKKNNLTGNISIVLETINLLIDRLSKIDNLPSLLNDHGIDTLNNKQYFAEFILDKGDGNLGNNFGQDLRNFRRFVEYAKAKGAATLYFMYG